jgi:hypothetical protein
VGLALVVHVTAGASLNEISRDPLATLGGHPLTGAQSVVGILVWWGAAATGFFTWAILRRLDGEARLISFFLWSAVITALLALDDQFQFHDDLAGWLFGLRERYVTGAIVIVLAVYLVRFRQVIHQSEWLLLGLAFAFGLGSLVGDFVSQQDLMAAGSQVPEPNLTYLEDTFKLLAIVSWSAYLVRFGLATVVSSLGKEAHRQA